MHPPFGRMPVAFLAGYGPIFGSFRNARRALTMACSLAVSGASSAWAVARPASALSSEVRTNQTRVGVSTSVWRGHSALRAPVNAGIAVRAPDLVVEALRVADDEWRVYLIR